METFHLLDLAENSYGNLSAAAACIIIADRYTDEFIDIQLKVEKEKLLGFCALEALISFKIDGAKVLNDSSCVWHKDYEFDVNK